MIPKIKIAFFLLLSLCLSLQLNAQQLNEKLIDAFLDYSDAPREVAYVHLNKSVYIEGEMLGFQAYFFDKFTKERSLMTSNVYCSIYDMDGNTVSEKLVYMVDGVANNVFNIDSTYTKSEYTFKAYTNYMLNFDEQNHFQQKFKVINADREEEIKLNSKSTDIELQLLAEGGHLVANVFNTVGVIAKNNLGYGIAKAKASIIDEQGIIVSEFTLNEFGLGKTIFKPNTLQNYILKVETDDFEKSINITDIKPIGITMTVAEVQNQVIVSLKTNKESLKIVGNSQYSLAVHNGNDLKLVPISFNDELEANAALNISDLFSGINIFTLFNENNSPILERMFFNYEGVKTNSIEKVTVNKKEDTLKFQFNLSKIATDKFNSLSVSVLPSGTKSYTHHNNILSSVYLQPYVIGAVENGSYYFNNPNKKTQYNLDLLLLTQGWSSYNWDNIFKGAPLLDKAFERGIDVVATVNNNEKGGTYLVYPLRNNTSEIFDLKTNENKFSQENLIPIENENFRAGYVVGKGKTKPSGIYPRFHPSRIPVLGKNTSVLNINFTEGYQSAFTKIGTSWERMEVLDEIILEGRSNNTRAEKLKSKSVNVKIDIVNDRDRFSGMRISTYLDRIGWVSNEFQGQFDIINPRVNRGPRTPLVYLDNVLITDLKMLGVIDMQVVDFVESDFYGLGGGGIRGNAGFIKIYTDPNLLNSKINKTTSVNSTKFPLTFSAEKTFYTPVYQFYNTPFFTEYGVIGWFPKLKPDNNGNFNLQALNTKTPTVNLYIEGITNDNQFVSEMKVVSIE